MTEALDQGLLLMALGMGTVFGFLSLLVGAMTLMSWLLAGDAAADAAATEPAGDAASLQAEGIDDPELISAIVAAVHRFRNERS